MRVLFTVSHPAHVHLFRNLIRELDARGHITKMTVLEKEVTCRLLDSFGIPYQVVGRMRPSFSGKAYTLALAVARLLRVARDFRPDLMVEGPGFAILGPVGKLLKKPVIIFDDTEDARLEHLLGDPFVDRIFTPSCYRRDLGPKQVRYPGYHELAYLHPSRFTPDPRVPESLGLDAKDTLILLRFVSWHALHDRGESGIRRKADWIRELERYGRVLISSESPLGKDLEPYRLPVPPEQLHDLLSFTTLSIGEGATVASESAVLGTHAIYVNTLRAGVQQEEEERYGLVSCFPDPATGEKEAFRKALSLLENPNLREEGRRKRERLLAEKIDVTGYMVRVVEGYPDSVAGAAAR